MLNAMLFSQELSVVLLADNADRLIPCGVATTETNKHLVEL